MTTYIYYNGIGAHKSGKHTVKNFLRRVATNSITKKLCINMFQHKTLAPCKKLRKTVKQFAKFKTIPKSLEEKYKKYDEACTAAKRKAPHRPCNLNNWIEYTGARKVVE